MLQNLYQIQGKVFTYIQRIVSLPDIIRLLKQKIKKKYFRLGL